MREPMRSLTHVINLIDISLVDRLSSQLAIYASDGREIMHIAADGRVVVNPEFTTNAAARAFWDAVKKLAAKP